MLCVCLGVCKCEVGGQEKAKIEDNVEGEKRERKEQQREGRNVRARIRLYFSLSQSKEGVKRI